MDAPRPLSVAEAQARILARFRRGEAETVSLEAALNQTLAADVAAPHDLPAFTNSAMDGYAVRATDIMDASLANPTSLTVVGIQTAGETASPGIQPGEAVSITTGAPLPPGADAVVRLEETDGGAERVAIRASVMPGANVRRQGEVARTGAPLLPAGTRLGPGEIALLAATGSVSPAVVRRPRVAILSTGNELVPAGAPMHAAQIADVNGPMLAALVAQYGGSAISLGIARDTPEEIGRALDAAHDVDLILSTGGVSVGAYDAVRAVIAARGTLDFSQVRMRPGRPTAFGMVGATPILALPGNPVAAFVAFHLLARPAMARMCGETPEIPPMVPACLRQAVENRGAQESYLRAILSATSVGWEADVIADQGTGNLMSLAAANALVIVSEGVARLAAGDTVNAMPLFR